MSVWAYMKLDGSEALGTLNSDGTINATGYLGNTLKTDDSARTTTITNGGGISDSFTGAITLAATGSLTTSVATTLNGALSSGVTTIPLTSAAAFNIAGGYALIGGATPEVIKYTGVSGSNLTGVSRGQMGTADSAHADLDAVNLYLEISIDDEWLGYTVRTSTTLNSGALANGIIRGLHGTTAAAHASGATLYSTTQTGTVYRPSSAPQYVTHADGATALRCRFDSNGNPTNTGRHSELKLLATDIADWLTWFNTPTTDIFVAVSVFIDKANNEALSIIPSAFNWDSVGFLRIDNAGAVGDLKVTGTTPLTEVNVPGGSPVNMSAGNSLPLGEWTRVMFRLLPGTGTGECGCRTAPVRDPMPSEQTTITGITHPATGDIRIRMRGYPGYIRKATGYFRHLTIGDSAQQVWGMGNASGSNPLKLMRIANGPYDDDDE